MLLNMRQLAPPIKDGSEAVYHNPSNFTFVLWIHYLFHLNTIIVVTVFPSLVSITLTSLLLAVSAASTTECGSFLNDDTITPSLSLRSTESKNANSLPKNEKLLLPVCLIHFWKFASKKARLPDTFSVVSALLYQSSRIIRSFGRLALPRRVQEREPIG